MKIPLKSTVIALVVVPFLGLQAADNNPNGAFLTPSWKSQRVTAATLVSKAKAHLVKDKDQATQPKSVEPQRQKKQPHQQFIAQMRAQVAQAEKEKEIQLQQ